MTGVQTCALPICTGGTELDNHPQKAGRLPQSLLPYEYAKHWLALVPDDPAAQKLVRDCDEYLEEEKALELDLKEREEIIRKETPDDVKKGGYL